MKPINLNQLLFHPKSSTLSFFLPPSEFWEEDQINVEEFLLDMQQQLALQGKSKLGRMLVKNQANIKKILKSHPEKSHGFFLAEGLTGYTILEHRAEPFCIIGTTFHVRPILQEIFINPEFILINVSLYDIKIFRGDFQHLEVIYQYDFDQLSSGIGLPDRARFYTPKYLGLIPYKTILAMKMIAEKAMETTQYQSLPVIVTGLEEIKKIFLRYFDHSGVISHFQEDFYEKTCVEIQERSRSFRYPVMDYYSGRLKDRISRLSKSKRVLTDLGEIIQATNKGQIIQLIIPTEKKLWGFMNFKTGEYELHKKVQKKNPSLDIYNELAEEVVKQGGSIQVLGPHFFPVDAHVVAILKG